MECRMRRIFLVMAALLLILGINARCAFPETVMEEEAQNYFREALTAQKSADVDSAISLYIKAIYAKPDFAKAHNNLGTAYTQKRDYVKAEEEYNKALMIDADYPVALKNIALMYAERGDYDKFYEYWKRATGLNAYAPFLIDDEDYKGD